MSVAIDLSGRTALVTGATRGIGAAIADALEAAGARLLLTGTSREEAERRDAGGAHPSRRHLAVDFSTSAGIRGFLDALGDTPVDICVNNAGINRVAPLEDVRDEDLELVTRVNQTAPHLVCRHLAPRMARAGHGRIVNVSSIWSVVARPGRSVYAATKCALDGLTRTLAVEYASRNVLANCVSPGFTLTELTRSTNSAEELAALADRVPQGRFARPEEIARTVLFLVSDLNTYLTGQNIVVDGGYTSV